MIGNKTFSSEEEQLLTLLDETQGHFPLLKPEDPVVFYNSAYERDLFMEYNLDFGGESPSSSLQHQMKDEEPMFMPDETKLEPAWLLSPSESEDQTASPSPYLHKSRPMKMPTIKRSQTSSFNPYSSGPLIKEPCSSRSRGYSSQMMYRSESPNSKRGRPVKATSDTKMANYARNYREQKKNQMSMLQMRNEELEAELRLFREEKDKMKTALSNAHAEIAHLKKVLDSDSQLARVVANMGAQSTAQMPAGRAGVCVHVGAHGTTVEVCKQCADNNQMRMDAKFTESFVQDFGNDTELFDGDFSAFDNYLNC